METKIKYDHIWIIKMSEWRLAERNESFFKRQIKIADRLHLIYLQKKLEVLEEFMGCHLIQKELKFRNRVYNRKTIILNKKWNTSFTTAKI